MDYCDQRLIIENDRVFFFHTAENTTPIISFLNITFNQPENYLEVLTEHLMLFFACCPHLQQQFNQLQPYLPFPGITWSPYVTEHNVMLVIRFTEECQILMNFPQPGPKFDFILRGKRYYHEEPGTVIRNLLLDYLNHNPTLVVSYLNDEYLQVEEVDNLVSLVLRIVNQATELLRREG